MILITGGNGFVGKQIVKNLLEEDKEILLIMREGSSNPFDYIKNIKVIKSSDIFIENEEWWTKAIQDVDTIIHSAWYASPKTYLNSIENLKCMNGTMVMAKAILKGKVEKFIGIGSCLEYERSTVPKTINTPLNPRSIYASTKVSTFFNLKNLFENKSSIKFAWCRLFFMYGENEPKEKLFSYVKSQLEDNKEVNLTDGTQIRDYMDVSDVGKVIKKISLNDLSGQFNICSGKGQSVKDHVTKIAESKKKSHLLKFGYLKNDPLDDFYIVGEPNYEI